MEALEYLTDSGTARGLGNRTEEWEVMTIVAKGYKFMGVEYYGYVFFSFIRFVSFACEKMEGMAARWASEFGTGSVIMRILLRVLRCRLLGAAIPLARGIRRKLVVVRIDLSLIRMVHIDRKRL